MDIVDVGSADKIVFNCIVHSCFPSVATEPIRSARKWKNLALFCS